MSEQMKKEELINEIKKFVEEESKKHFLGMEIFKNHLVSVVDYCGKISDKLINKGENVDKEILKIAAWLHDVGSVVEGRENHHVTGARIAEEKLNEFEYPKEKIEIVKECILNHRGSREENNHDSIESKILVDADAASAFDNLAGQFLWVIEGENVREQEQIRNRVREKLFNSYNKLLFKESRELIKPKYEAAMLLLNKSRENIEQN